MSYEAIICKAKNVRSHPNAQKIALATSAGHQVIVGLNTKEGDLGIFFPPDGEICKEHLLYNKLYNKHPDTGEPMGGYFNHKGKVTAQKFRGEISEGFWQPIEGLSWAGEIDKLKHGDKITEINGHKLCWKYIPPRQKSIQKQIRKNNENSIKRVKENYSMFKEHYDTKQLRNYVNLIPEGAVISITCKLHGTSGRTGRINIKKKYNKWYDKLLVKFGFKNTSEWGYVSGSRRVILKDKQNDSYYRNSSFRQEIHNKIKEIGLHKGETLYYEIVGFQGTGDNAKPIMPPQEVKNKQLRKQYGKQMLYKYDCDPFVKPYDFYIYRITMTNEDNHTVEYSWPQIVARCNELGFKHVPVIKEPFLNPGEEKLLDICKYLSEGPDIIDPSHIKEGIVVRVEHSKIFMALKYKSFDFLVLEGIAKDNDDFVDPEDIE